MTPRRVTLSIGRVAAAAVVWFSSASAVAPRVSAQAAVDAQSIRYPASAGATLDAYIARPKGVASKIPAIILVHDDLGLNHKFRELTDQLAQAGFVAMAPDLASRAGTPAAEPQDGRPGRTPVATLRWPQTVADLTAAYKFLQQDAGVDAARISAVGVGWGEYRVWKLAEQTPTLYRAVVSYGITPTDDEELRTVRAAVLGHYAEQDYLITARVLKTKKLLGEKFTYYIYPTVPGFFGGGSGQMPAPTGGAVVNLAGTTPEAAAAAAKQAWTRTVEFLR